MSNAPETRPARRPKRVAIMQPYFFPYAGYFRLFVNIDVFVILDDVQFMKGGRIHRTELPGPRGRVEWLTLPLSRHSLTTPIKDVCFASDARRILNERLARHPWIETTRSPIADRVRELLFGPLLSLIDFLEAGLLLVTEELGFENSIVRASCFQIDAALKGQARVLALLAALDATHYVNAPGGRPLYSADDFGRAGIDLQFLCPYAGAFCHMLSALMTIPPDRIRADVIATSSVSP